MIDQSQYKNRHSKKSLVLRRLWNVAWLLLFRPVPRGLGNRWKCFLLRCFGAKIGKGSFIHSSCKIWAPWHLTVGDHTCLSEHVECYSVAPIHIGSNVTVSQGTFLCTASHDISSIIMELTFAPITIKDQVWVAARAFIGPMVTIGEGAVVGACSVVTKDVAPWTVVVGNPSKFIKHRVLEKGAGSPSNSEGKGSQNNE